MTGSGFRVRRLLHRGGALAAMAMLAACQSAPPAAPAAPAANATLAADDPSWIPYGRRVAVQHCAECHALDVGQVSPLADAPPFPILYTRFPVEQLGTQLEGGMMVGHERMPLLTQLDPDDTRALVAYLNHFRPAAGH